MMALGFGLLMALACAYSVAAIAWFIALSNLFRTIRNRRPGVPLWHWRLAYFPPNIVFFPDLLTERGRLCRRRFGLAMVAFLGAVAIGLVLDRLISVLP
jgi:hypothetical protein